MVVALVVFAYLVVLRTRHISETFWLLGDQILYWKIALGSWRDLPLGGGPSSVGGTTLGPAFLWIIWVVRHVVGPWVDNLPHAGGIGICIIQSAADAVLLAALWQRFESVTLALAVTLLVATAPYDMALTATIWNPPVAVALVKVTIALVLSVGSDGSIWWGAAATATALLAVQTHSSAIFVAAPVIVSLTVRDLLAHRPRRAAARACASLAVIVVLEAPFLLDLALHPQKKTNPAVVTSNVAYTLAHPEALRPAAAFRALASACAFLLLRPWTFPWFAALLAASTLVTLFRARHDIVVVSVTVLPFARCGGGVFALAADIRPLLVHDRCSESWRAVPGSKVRVWHGIRAMWDRCGSPETPRADGRGLPDQFLAATAPSSVMPHAYRRDLGKNECERGGERPRIPDRVCLGAAGLRGGCGRREVAALFCAPESARRYGHFDWPRAIVDSRPVRDVAGRSTPQCAADVGAQIPRMKHAPQCPRAIAAHRRGQRA